MRPLMAVIKFMNYVTQSKSIHKKHNNLECWRLSVIAVHVMTKEDTVELNIILSGSYTILWPYYYFGYSFTQASGPNWIVNCARRN